MKAKRVIAAGVGIAAAVAVAIGAAAPSVPGKSRGECLALSKDPRECSKKFKRTEPGWRFDSRKILPVEPARDGGS